MVFYGDLECKKNMGVGDTMDGQKEKKFNEEEMLREYCKTRDIKLRNELVKHYLYIAEIIAKKFVIEGLNTTIFFR